MNLDSRGDEPSPVSRGGRRYLFVAAALAILLPAIASAYFFVLHEPNAFGAAVVEFLLILALGLAGLLHLLLAGLYVGARHHDPVGWTTASVAGALLALGALGLGMLLLA